MVGVNLLVFLAILAALEAVHGTYQYLGCFDNEEYLVSGISEMIVTGATDNTPDSCGYICADAGFRYAGLIAGSRCVCGNSYEADQPRTDCTTPCPGNSAEKCGGSTSASVWATGKACFSDLYNMQLYFITDPYVTSVNVSGATIAKQYERGLGLEACQQACALDADCVSYTYYTASRAASTWGQRCYGFTFSADIARDTHKDGLRSGSMTACYAYDRENLIGEAFGMGLAIILLICLILNAERIKKK